MKREYWNNLAASYEDEIFSVLANDKKKLIPKLVKKYGSPAKKVNDFGCGIGHFLPLLSANFGKVNAIDISYKFIARAKKKHKHLSNIEYITADLAKPKPQLEKTHFAMSVNMLIMPSLTVRLRILDVMAKHILKNGHLLLVVPSLESAMLTNFRLIQWNLRNGASPSTAARASFGKPKKSDSRYLRQGIVPIDGVPTKHYIKEELTAILRKRKLQITDLCKIGYPWTTEFASPPRWMKKPYPWDWLVAAKKTK
ncbi:MAG: class I SAM-dependent methyltransferase [Planctomycetes bacterium]|nr:class I SAM-dependent methyltransferase [Planctomycetota bacterium]